MTTYTATQDAKKPHRLSDSSVTDIFKFSNQYLHVDHALTCLRAMSIPLTAPAFRKIDMSETAEFFKNNNYRSKIWRCTL